MPARARRRPRSSPFDAQVASNQNGLWRQTSDALVRRRPRLRLSQPIKGFVVEADDGRTLVCREVRGFREAMLAAHDPRAPMPSRLVLLLPDAEMGEWLACWSEDSERVRRTITVRRLFDGKQVTAVATLASYGYAVDTSLGVESIAAEAAGPGFRSGVHGRGSTGLEA